MPNNPEIGKETDRPTVTAIPKEDEEYIPSEVPAGIDVKKIERDDIIHAFPFFDSENLVNSQGMTLADYFAAVALQGILSSYSKTTLDPLLELSDGRGYRKISKQAYDFAQAMLEERERPKENFNTT